MICWGPPPARCSARLLQEDRKTSQTGKLFLLLSLKSLQRNKVQLPFRENSENLDCLLSTISAWQRQSPDIWLVRDYLAAITTCFTPAAWKNLPLKLLQLWVIMIPKYISKRAGLKNKSFCWTFGRFLRIHNFVLWEEPTVLDYVIILFHSSVFNLQPAHLHLWGNNTSPPPLPLPPSASPHHSDFIIQPGRHSLIKSEDILVWRHPQSWQEGSESAGQDNT